MAPLDFSHVRSDQFQKQCEEEHKQALYFIGMKKGQFLRLCPGLDVVAIAKHLQGMCNRIHLSQAESEDLNQFFWDLYFAQSGTIARKEI